MKRTTQQRRSKDKYGTKFGIRNSEFGMECAQNPGSGLELVQKRYSAFRIPHSAFCSFRIPNSEFRISTHVPRPASRSGATLTEVLIALLIMSIGIVSLAVLFPISVLRSIKATQFTTATDNRFNAEAMIDLYPNMIRNPDGQTDPVTGLLLPNTWNGFNFIVDPLGFAIVNNATPGRSNNFGNYQPPPPAAAGNVPWPNLRRFPYLKTLGAAQQYQEKCADRVVTMPDSWVVQYTGGGSNPVPAAAVGTTQLDVAGLTASGFTAIPAGTQVRAVIFSADNQTSQTRTLTQVTGNTVQWTEDLNGNNALDPGEDLDANGSLDQYPLPASFVPGGKVRIEMQERRYSWLLTVRKDILGGASVDVVVFFKRKFDSDVDELLYEATFTSGSTIVTNVKYTAANKPFMKKGSYIFDANNAYWYRISNVTEKSSTLAEIVLDTPANASSPDAATGIPARAMFPRNIVDVYPIGSK